LQVGAVRLSKTEQILEFTSKYVLNMSKVPHRGDGRRMASCAPQNCCIQEYVWWIPLKTNSGYDGPHWLDLSEENVAEMVSNI
jgi:hypothetical protein